MSSGVGQKCKNSLYF